MKAIDRIYKILEERNLKPSNIEKSLGLANGYLQSAKKRNSDIGESILLKLSKYLDVNLNYLITGEEPSIVLGEPDIPYSAKDIIELQKEVINLQRENALLKEFQRSKSISHTKKPDELKISATSQPETSIKK